MKLKTEVSCHEIKTRPLIEKMNVHTKRRKEEKTPVVGEIKK
jgi:hypothetical protein